MSTPRALEPGDEQPVPIKVTLAKGAGNDWNGAKVAGDLDRHHDGRATDSISLTREGGAAPAAPPALRGNRTGGPT